MRRYLFILYLFTLWLFGFAGTALAAAANERFSGPEGKLLPFAADAAAVEFLATAEVVSSRELPGGTNRTLQVLLEKDGVRAHAAFRTVDRRIERAVVGDRVVIRFEDNHRFEVAAYELSRLLGMSEIPPTVLRRIDGEDGSLQLWIEGATTELDRRHRGEPEVTGPYFRRQQVMRLFDRLIDNFDRNLGNLLIDGAGHLWLIDHTRSFRLTAEVEAIGTVTQCERRFYDRLEALDLETLREHLDPYLDRPQIRFLWRRRAKVLEHCDALAEQFGEAAFFGLPP